MDNWQINWDKRKAVVLWLAKFGFSSRQLIALMLGRHEKGQSKFFANLINEGLIKEQYVGGTRKKILLLTNDGFRLAKIFEPDLSVKKLKRFPLATLIHSYTIQSFLVKQTSIAGYVTENELAKEKWERRPDLVLINGNESRIAIEIELTQKDSNRIYANFYSHIRDWESGRLHKVIYLFQYESVKKRYEQLYSEEVWPRVLLNSKNVRHIKASGSINAKPAHDSKLIHFAMFEAYKL